MYVTVAAYLILFYDDVLWWYYDDIFIYIWLHFFACINEGMHSCLAPLVHGVFRIPHRFNSSFRMFLHEENVVVEDEMCAVSSKVFVSSHLFDAFVEEASQEMCFVCFDSLLAHFVGKELPKASVSGYPNHLWWGFLSFPDMKTKVDLSNIFCEVVRLSVFIWSSPLFVTWEKLEGGISRMRGCIGTLTATQLCESLTAYALHSALRDSRFPSIELHELSSLSCKLSLLHSSECTRNYLDWTVGVHGLKLEFMEFDVNNDSRSTFTAIYLPEIPVQENWTKEETIHSLIRKSGYQGHITNQLKSSLKITRYQSSVSVASYEEYTRARECT